MPGSSSSGDSIPLNKLQSRTFDTLDDEERETLLEQQETKQPLEPRPYVRTLGAVWQIVIFTILGLIIAFASGAFVYHLRARLKAASTPGFVHAPLPGVKNPSILKYFGGNGPYIGGVYVPPPEQCTFTQLHMISRHGERYPTTGTGALIANFARNISGLQDNFYSDLEFLNGWTLETDDWLYDPNDQLEHETLTGPAAGSIRMFTLGSEFRARYGDLWGFRDHTSVKLWSSDSTRVIHSAGWFAQGFFGPNTTFSVDVIPETEDQWGNTLTTGATCAAFQTNSSKAFNDAPRLYLKTFISKVADRLNKMSKEYKLTERDVLAMSTICPFQINALGHSPFCDIFEEKEWMDFNYVRDLGSYYGSGPGNPYGKVMGQPWVEAVIDLMKRDTSTNSNLYFSFSHDTDIIPMVPALGIFPSPHDNPLPADTYDSDRVFWTTAIVPMGGHIVIERLDCGSSGPQVRVLVNERIQSVPGCESAKTLGAGLCDLNQFETIVKGRWDTTFCEACAPDEPDCVDSISFFES